MDPTAAVVLWWLAFAGSHTFLSHPPVRSAIVARTGEQPFQGLYSVIALGIFVPLVWTFFGNRASTAMPLPVLAQTPGVWWLTMALMLVAVFLLVLGFVRPSPLGIIPGVAPKATGILRVTRHPVFMAFALIGLAHLFVNHRPIDRAFFGGALVYSLLGAAHQDWRKRIQGGEPMREFFERTSFLPFVAIATGRNHLAAGELGALGIALSLVVYALIFVFHHRIFS